MAITGTVPCIGHLSKMESEESMIELKACVKGNIGDAVRWMKEGLLVAREGWNEKEVCLAYQPGYPEGIPCNKNTSETWHLKEGEIFRCGPYLQMRNGDGTYQMWSGSSEDILAEDWYVQE